MENGKMQYGNSVKRHCCKGVTMADKELDKNQQEEDIDIDALFAKDDG